MDERSRGRYQHLHAGRGRALALRHEIGYDHKRAHVLLEDVGARLIRGTHFPGLERPHEG
ncbi:hypothetical protein GCM10023322_11790 [Rugosimonospora acidiphila]|uniref:Uncharacterized protein n=1 Tax=Rugosimonospora acidiphila TaxID=556531 RepID=A0ABP9RMB5_9ACTN